jgi:hypothetical protein
MRRTRARVRRRRRRVTERRRKGRDRSEIKCNKVRFNESIIASH